MAHAWVCMRFLASSSIPRFSPLRSTAQSARCRAPTSQYCFASHSTPKYRTVQISIVVCRLAQCTSMSCRIIPHFTVQVSTSLCSSGSCIIVQRLRRAVQHRCLVAKGLRCRVRPVCTLSQNGYCDWFSQAAESQFSPCYMTTSKPASSRRRGSGSERVSEDCPSLDRAPRPARSGVQGRCLAPRIGPAMWRGRVRYCH